VDLAELVEGALDMALLLQGEQMVLLILGVVVVVGFLALGQ
jgi:hypothetical protein